MTSSLPTDRFILEAIYDMYKGDYPGASHASGAPGHENDPYLPIDVKAVAAKLETDANLLFGRLHYDLDKKHRYQVEEAGKNTWTHLFAFKVGERMHCVNFPYLSAVLAGHNQEFRNRIISYGMSAFAIAISISSLAVNLLTKH